MLRLEAFGGLTLRSDAGELVVTQRRRLALVVLVACAGDRGITRDKLMACLWPERSAEAARHSLEQLFYALRHDADETLFHGTNPIRLNPTAVVSDSREFELAIARGALGDAAAWYRGPFLEGFFLSDAPVFERWAESERARLASLYARVLASLATTASEAGNHKVAADWWGKLVALDPLRGASALVLMRALAASGDRAGALRYARAYEIQLRDELGTDIDADVAAFVRILRTSSSHATHEEARGGALSQAETRSEGVRLTAASAARLSPATTLAVLPFTYLGDDAEGEYFSDGVTDEILTALMRVDGLHVASRLSTLPFRTQRRDLSAIRDTLHVKSVLDGSVRRWERALRITVRLTDATTGRQLWAESYDGNLTDVFRVQAQIASAIASALQPTLAPRAPVIRHHTDDPEAYNLYLKGRYHWNKRPRETLKGLSYFEQAIARDPQFALAYAGVADAYNTLASWEAGVLPVGEAAAKARAAALRALELDPTSAEAHTSIAYANTHFLWRWDDAEREFAAALSLDPTYSHAHHWHSHYLMARGRIAESLAASQRALELDPVDVIINVHLAWHYWVARQYDECAEQCFRTRELDEHDHWPPFFLGLAYAHKGMFGRAVSEHRKSLARSNASPVMLGALGHTYLLAGHRSEGMDVLRQLETLSEQRHVFAYEIALLYVALGNADVAFQWLDKAVAERSAWLAYLSVEPRLDPLRSDARFAALLARVGHASPPPNAHSLPAVGSSTPPPSPARR
jgi:TolB-like protein/DNA-binding SARP family transcriptional activator/Flp pilus assembly protein TadD